MAKTRPGIEELSARHWRELHGMLLAITRNATLAEDLTQEVFVVALQKGMRAGARVQRRTLRASRLHP